MPTFNPRDFKVGDVLTARMLNEILAGIRQLQNIRVGSGLNFRRGAGGFQLALSPRPGEFIVRAKVTTAIATGSWSSPSSSGRAQVRRKNNSGAWVDDGDPVVVWNDNTLSASIPVNRVIKLGWIEGEWWLLTASCS